MARVINLESAGKDRKKLLQAVTLALRELGRQTGVDTHTKDLAAFIAMTLEGINRTIDPSVAAWEKRGYWLKADRFRMEWSWTGSLGESFRKALLEDDWRSVASLIPKLADKVKGVNLPQHSRLGTPWDGAWDLMLKEKGSQPGSSG